MPSSATFESSSSTELAPVQNSSNYEAISYSQASSYNIASSFSDSTASTGFVQYPSSESSNKKGHSRSSHQHKLKRSSTANHKAKKNLIPRKHKSKQFSKTSNADSLALRRAQATAPLDFYLTTHVIAFSKDPRVKRGRIKVYIITDKPLFRMVKHLKQLVKLSRNDQKQIKSALANGKKSPKIVTLTSELDYVIKAVHSRLTMLDSLITRSQHCLKVYREALRRARLADKAYQDGLLADDQWEARYARLANQNAKAIHRLVKDGGRVALFARADRYRIRHLYNQIISAVKNEAHRSAMKTVLMKKARRYVDLRHEPLEITAPSSNLRYLTYTPVPQHKEPKVAVCKNVLSNHTSNKVLAPQVLSDYLRPEELSQKLGYGAGNNHYFKAYVKKPCRAINHRNHVIRRGSIVKIKRIIPTENKHRTYSLLTNSLVITGSRKFLRLI